MSKSDKFSEITGETTNRRVVLELGRLKEEGVLVDLNITGTGMFQRTPSWAELGIPDWTGDQRTKTFTKGAKFLFPEEKVRALKSFESRLRQNLDRKSFKVSAVYPYSWIPYTAYQQWREDHDKIVAEAMEYVERQIIGDFEGNVDYVAGVFAIIAEEAWVSATSGDNDRGKRVQLYDWVVVWDEKKKEKVNLDHDGFVDWIVSRAISQVPTIEQIRERLKFDYVTALVYGQEEIARDEAEAENIRLQRDFQREEAQIKLQEDREKVRKLAWFYQYEQQKKEKMLEAMRQAEYDHHRQQLKETVSPFAEVYNQAISQFVKHAKEILESVKKNGYVRGKVAERGRGLLDMYNLLVIPGMGDEKMMSLLEQLREQIGLDGSERKVESIEETLQSIMGLENEVAEFMSAPASSFGLVEVD